MREKLNLLLPRPRQAELRGAPVPVGPGVDIIREAAVSGRPDAIAGRVAGCFASFGIESRIIADKSLRRASAFPVILTAAPSVTGHKDGYEINVSGQGISIRGATEAGLFYGALTLIQVLKLGGEQSAGGLLVPSLCIRDWPDFDARGVMLDVSRDKVPAMETLYDLIELFASLKYNQVQLYFEHVFAYEGHEIVWKEASPFTAGEIRALDDFCGERHIELVPNQNSFGHFHRWLIHDKYRDLAECPDGFEHMFSLEKEPFGLNPLDPRSLELLEDIYDQLLPLFRSDKFNAGLDETFDLGAGRSAQACAEGKKPLVYLDYLLKVHELVTKRNHTMMYWGDVVFTYPELIEKLPRDAVALIWGYEGNHPFEAQTKRMGSLGFSYYVCPGTSSWNSIAGRTDNLIENLKNASLNGNRNGAAGLLIADWGDNGHLQPLPVSYPGFVAGALAAWNTGAVLALDAPQLAELLDFHVFGELPGDGKSIGKTLVDLGNVYTCTGSFVPNFSSLFLLLSISSHKSGRDILSALTPEALLGTRRRITEIAGEAGGGEGSGLRGNLVLEELGWAADMLAFCCDFGLFRLAGETGASVPPGPWDSAGDMLAWLDGLMERHSALWLKRNRPGGLKDSLKRLEHVKNRIAAMP